MLKQGLISKSDRETLNIKVCQTDKLIRPQNRNTIYIRNKRVYWWLLPLCLLFCPNQLKLKIKLKTFMSFSFINYRSQMPLFICRPTSLTLPIAFLLPHATTTRHTPYKLSYIVTPSSSLYLLRSGRNFVYRRISSSTQT